jgi:hypothetical protein
MTLTDFRSEIISGFSTLDPKVDPTKAAIELDPISADVANLLAEPSGLVVIDFINEDLIRNKVPFFLTDSLPDKNEVDKIVEYFFDIDDQKNLKIILRIYDEFWQKSKSTTPDQFFEGLKKFGASKGIISKKTVLKICCNCFSDTLETSPNDCCKSQQNILEVSELILHEKVESVLRYNQHLEIYVKNHLNKLGIETIGWEKDRYGREICTSIIYQIDGEPVEIDAIGITKPLAILLIETKTSKNISMSEIRKTGNKFDGIISKIGKIITNHKFTFLKIFVTTGTFDPNLSISGYHRQGWVFVDGVKIDHIDDEFEKIQNSL